MAGKRKMSRDITVQRMAELFGMQVPEDYTPPPPEEVKKIETDNISREAEAVLEYAYHRDKFIQRECKNCGGVFAVDRGNVAFDSDHCRKVWLEKIGIIWNPIKNPALRWEFREPLIVPPQVLPHLPEIASQLEQQQREQQEAEHQQAVQKNKSELDSLLAELQID